MPESNAARRTGAFDLGAGDLRKSEPIGHETRQHLLPGERPRDEVAEIKRPNLLAVEPGLDDRGIGGADCQRSDVGIAVTPEGRRPDTRDINLPHDDGVSTGNSLRNSVLRVLPYPLFGRASTKR